MITNQFCIAVFDSQTGQMLDFVNIGSLVLTNDLNQALLALDLSTNSPWMTNGANGCLSSPPSQGVLNQIAVCFGEMPMPAGYDYDDNVAEYIESLRYWWTNASAGPVTMAAFFAPVAAISLDQIYQAPGAVAHYTLGDMVDPHFLGQTYYFETNGCSAVLYELIYEGLFHTAGCPMRTNAIAPYMVVSNNNVYCFDCGGVILGPFPLADISPLKLSLAAQRGNLSFSWNARTNLQYQVEVSTNLPYFIPLSQITPNSTQAVFLDSLPIQAAQWRFFRVRTLP
jgi:hypothetical protein